MRKDIFDEINSEKSALESVDLDNPKTDDTKAEEFKNQGSDSESSENESSESVSGENQSGTKSGDLQKSLKSRILSFAIFTLSLAIAFCGGLVVRNYVLTPVQVAQSSMFDTLSDGDRLYINQLDKGGQFDIVVIDEPIVSYNWLIKRIIATGGQEIEITDGILYITDNGITTEYREEYVNGENITQEKVYIPEGYIYVLGDNRSVSVDSQDYGVISWERVVGTAIFIDSEDAVVINSYPAT